MLLFPTEYKLQTYDKPKATFFSYVIANNEFTAKAILKLRGTKEKIIGPGINPRKTLRQIKKPSKLYKERNLLECLHTLCFVGNILCNAKIMNHREFLLDNGFLHDIVHEACYPEFKFSLARYKDLKKIDKLIEDLGF